MGPKKENSIRPIPALDLGHERVERFLAGLRRDALPSLMFSGPEGSGKEYTALEFARRLCCDLPEPCQSGPGGCELCARASVLSHPGIYLVYPTPTQGSGEADDGDVTDIAKVLDEKRRDVFSRYQFYLRILPAGR